MPTEKETYISDVNNVASRGSGEPDYSTTGTPVPDADVSTNTYSRDVVGNKSDAAVTTVGVVASIVAYIKGILNNLALVKTATDKLAGAATVGSTTANWNTATGTSGEAGEDLVTIGADDTKYKLLSLMLDVSACTDGVVLTVKMFSQINGTERKVYSEGFVVNTDPDGLWIVTSPVGIHEALRVEVYSNTSESKAIAYDYMLEAM